MQVIILPDRDKAAELVARMIERLVRGKPDAVLGLATGVTMERLYAILVRIHREEGLDFSRVHTFNLDEYVGLSPKNENSYHHYMGQHLFSHVNLDSKRTHLPHGDAGNLTAECRRYEKLIKDCGGIDLQLLGIGRDGHIGFNEPLSALQSRTRDKSLTPDTVAANSQLFARPEDMPRRALTMGVGTILECRRLIMLVTGSTKAPTLAKAVEGPITSMVTASAVQLHPHCTVIADKGASTDLQARDYYDWIFENEPEWKYYRQKLAL